MKQFIELLKESTILQAVLTVMIWGVISYMFATGQNPPDALLNAGMAILGYYFGSKSQYYISKLR